MNSSLLLGITTVAYLVSSVFYILLFLFRSKPLGLIAITVTIMGFIAQTWGIGLRWVESYQIGYGHAPLTNIYESLVFFAWCIIATYIFLEFKIKNRSLGAFVTPFAVAAMISAPFLGKTEIDPLLPALQSNWLLIHVMTCFIGYAAFAVGCGFAIIYLLKTYAENPPKGTDNDSVLASLPDPRTIDELMHKTILFGFLWLSAGIITGAIWANEAWGTYWQWDAKETWSLITWFMYALILHARFTRGWHGKVFAWLSFIGFSSVLFTYFGVNYLPNSLHSYGGFDLKLIMEKITNFFN